MADITKIINHEYLLIKNADWFRNKSYELAKS